MPQTRVQEWSSRWGLRALHTGAALFALALAACGGAGGDASSGSPEPEGPLDGLRGIILREGVDLGRIAECEPNDAVTQPLHLAPLHPACRVEVAGTVAVDAAAWGTVDPTDVLRVVSLVDQTIEFSLAFALDDADGLGSNTVRLELIDPVGPTVLETDEGTTSPRVLSVPCVAHVPVLVRVTAVAGHVPYVLAIEGSNPAPPAPVVLMGEKGRPIAAPHAAGGSSAFPSDLADERNAIEATATCCEHHVLAGFAEGADPHAVADAVGATLGRRLAGGGWCVDLPEAARVGPGEAAARGLVTRLRAHPKVRWAEPDYVLRPLGMALDARFAEQWNLHVIGAPGAWDITRGENSVVIGVVDSGIIDHPDLAGRVVGGYDFISSTAVSADGDGRDADPTDIGDRLLPSGLSSWHGTHVASLAVGGQGTTGISGVAPGCRVLPLRVVGRGGGLVSDGADAILFAAGLYTTADGQRLDSPLRVVNLSLGTPVNSAVLEDACARAAEAGVLLVAAVGNDGGSNVLYPARYPSVMAVAAVDRGLISTSYSNFGDEVEIAAPGGNANADRAGIGWSEAILGAVRDQTVEPPQSAHVRLMGTSQAAPHVAAAAALLFSVDPALTAEDARALLRSTARDLTPVGEDMGTGSGLLQVSEAVRRAREELVGADPRSPALGLGWSSVRLSGLEERDNVPLANVGGGRLNVGVPTSATEDGAPWLFALPMAPTDPSDSISHASLQILIVRAAIPPGPDWVTGIVTVRDTLGTPLGRIVVNVARGVLLRQGADLGAVAFHASSGGSLVARSGRATADTAYRFWFTGLAAGFYNVRGGEDIDRDGFFCEPSDACAWWGGPTLDDAIDVGVVPGEPAGAPGVIVLAPPP